MADAIEKQGQQMNVVRKRYDHSIVRVYNGHSVLIIALRFRGVLIPW